MMLRTEDAVLKPPTPCTRINEGDAISPFSQFSYFSSFSSF